MHVHIPADLRAALERALPAPLMAALQQAAQVADSLNIPAYLVGGPVRDLLLGRPVDDLDLVFEGNAITVAEHFVALVGGEITRHTAFGTAKVTFGGADGSVDVDFVTARHERYPQPAALPLVEPASITADLWRRDFTINTLAIRLYAAQPYQLLDVCRGVADLQGGRVRALHDRSFVDDPTRIVRAARFAARLGFMIDQHTAHLIETAVKDDMIERTTPIRILHELWLLLREPAPEHTLALLDQLGALARVAPGLGWSAELADHVLQLRTRLLDAEHRRLGWLGLLAWHVAPQGSDAFTRRYPWTSVEHKLLGEVAAFDTVFAALAQPELPPSHIDRLLQPFGEVALALMEVVAPASVRAHVAHYQDTLRPLRSLITGDDLRALGIPPGPHYRALLQAVRSAQLDGKAQNREDALRWLQAAWHEAEHQDGITNG